MSEQQQQEEVSNVQSCNGTTCTKRDTDSDYTDWENLWKVGRTRWDQGKSSPALVKLFQNDETRSLVPEHGQGLVPGCGRGYDVVFLANKHRHMTGLDMSPTCVEILNKDFPDAAANNYEFKCADFFNFDVPNEGYDLAYDYTFLCALPPKIRPDWAARYAEIMKKNQGILITLIYPIGDHKDGPPFAVNEQLYRDLLSPNFHLLYINDAEGHEDRLGKEKIAIWKRME